MNILSTIKGSLLGLLLLAAVPVSATDLIWPIKGEIDLSSTFCDFRQLHFHGGIDLRTGGTEGRRIYAPVDGYVWRIKYSYEGYGKGLYLKDSQGFIYVFGHLSRLSEKLERTIREIQYKNEKYQFDQFFAPGDIPVSQGELVAYSGQSGYGAPHIHFERRDQDNFPLNPLTNGFPIPDTYPPQFARLELIYQDSGSVFYNGQRRLFLDPESCGEYGQFEVKPAILVRGPFGVAVKAYDKVRANGFRLNIYRARLYIDDYLYYEVTYDRYNFDQTAMVDLSYDYCLTIRNKEDWHLLFNPPGKKFDGSRSYYEKGGIFTGRTQYSYGLHRARIEIYDASGNMSELVFHFVFAPPGNFFEIEWMSDSLFYLTGSEDLNYIDLNNILIYGLGNRAGWEKMDQARIEPRGRADYRVELPTADSKMRAIRVDVEGESGWYIVDRYIPLEPDREYKYRFDYTLADGGILVDITADQKIAPVPRLDVVYEDGYISSHKAVPVSEKNFAAFYYDERIKTRIIRLDVYDDTHNIMTDSKDVNIILVGNSPGTTSLVGSEGISVTFNQTTFYSPNLIEVKSEQGQYPQSGKFLSPVYSIDPETVPLAGRLDITFRYDQEADPAKIGIYRLNSKDQWTWFDSRIDGEKISAESRVMGEFAVIEDSQAPRIKNLSPGNGKTISIGQPEIKCTISEELSGIKDDNVIRVLLDGQWLIPEYDPEIELMKTSPRGKLSPGRHELVIEAADRVGNRRVINSHFFVKK